MTAHATVVTGANGFIGGHLANRLAEAGDPVSGCTRSNSPSLQPFDQAAWTNYLQSADTLVHVAAAVPGRPSGNLAAADRFQLNANAPARLLTALAEAGGRRFVFVSSISVHGHAGADGSVLDANTEIAPTSPYGHEKAIAEQQLSELADEHSIELVVVRPVSVYGPGSNSPLERLAAAVRNGRPIPLPATSRARHFLSIESLVELLAALSKPGGPTGHYLAADETGITTREIVASIADQSGQSTRTITVPDLAWSSFKRLPIIGPTFASLGDALIVDCSALSAAVGWAPSSRIIGELTRLAGANDV